MRVDTDILKEAADSRVKICKKLENRSLELQRLIKELETYDGLDDICSMAREINACLIKDILMIRQTGIALHSISRIYEDGEKLIADHSDGTGFIIKGRELGILNDLEPLRSSYERIVRGDKLQNVGGEEK